MKKIGPSGVIGLLIVAVVCLALFTKGRPLYYAKVIVAAPERIELIFLSRGRASASECLAAAEMVANVAGASCPGCRVVAQECPTKLEPEFVTLLSDAPVSIPTSRLPNGVLAYRLADSEAALAACMETERLSAAARHRITCYAPGVVRPLPVPKKPRPGSEWQAASGLLVLLLSVLSSVFAGYLIIRYERLHSRWSFDHLGTGPQKFHSRPTPRIGGVGVLIGLLVGGIGILSFPQRLPGDEFGLLLLASLPAFAGGMAEDISKRTGVLPRLLLTMLAAALGAWLLGAVLPRLDIAGVDSLLAWAPLSIAITLFAVAGVANAINIIDGYNGLAGGYSVLVLAALAWVSAQVGDALLATSALAMIGALLGFLFWNYPKGKLFLGDGGAYLLGFWMAELSVLLVVRHPEVSPWFPLLLLIYPVFETLFSIYRKKVLRGHSPGHPDGLHFHMLVYKRLMRRTPGSQIDADMRNNRVASRIWTMSLFCIVPAVLFWRDTGWLLFFTVSFCAWYVWLYRRMMRWRTPSWLIKSNV